MSAFLFLFGPLFLAQGSLQVHQNEAFRFEVVEFRPNKDHHFELSAPQECTQAQVIEKSKDLIRCQMLEVGNSSVTLNVCDDAKTFCKPFQFNIQVKEGSGQALPVNSVSGELVGMKESLHQELLEGFEILDLNSARKKASENSGKPVLILISTDWCPPCNQSKEYLLSTPEFKNFTKDWVKIYVDGDSASSIQYDEEFNFFEYPTFLLVNSQFKEVSRYREEFALEEFKSWWDRVEPYLDSGYSLVKEKVIKRKQGSWWQALVDFILWRSADAKSEDLNFVLEVALARGDKDFLKLIKFEDVQMGLRDAFLSNHLVAEILSDSMTKEELALKALMTAGLKPSYVSHLREVCTLGLLQCEEGKSTLDLRPKLIMSREKRTKAENLAAVADEHFAQMGFYRENGDLNKVKEQAKSCVEVFEKLIGLSVLRFPRYSMQGLSSCAKQFDLKRAEESYKKIIAQYPDDPTFALAYAKYLKNDVKDLKQAKVWAKKALEKSYDFNWFYAASLKIQIDIEMKQFHEALATLNDGFSRLQLSSDQESRHQQVLVRLRQLERTVNEAAQAK